MKFTLQQAWEEGCIDLPEYEDRLREQYEQGTLSYRAYCDAIDLTRKPISVTVNTTMYEFAHGKAPRGVGLWFFEFSRHVGLEGTAVRSWTGAYSVAKREAVKFAKETGFPIVRVMS